ncbi:alkaline phosphatase family protein [Desulfovibrio inopinatus]|uniref:alkaline phosphatase family protein n=1 Tax=Desulfovibrio inopinatus TaxID=102109 RepID=UPI0004141D21|nr:alkaline phosphatase family protein [Desulfovibrio inopinatus]
MARKCILIVLDGLGDRSYPEFAGKTPLEAAHTPTLDEFARRGANGLFHAGHVGTPFSSENAHFPLFGYDQCDFPGRGALEALGAGVDLAADDVALLAHFVCLHERPEGVLLEQDDPKAEDIFYARLASQLEPFHHDGMTASFHRTKGRFGIIQLSGKPSVHITDTNPMVDGRFVSDIQPWAGLDPEEARIAHQTAECVREYLTYIHHALRDVPENIMRTESGLPPVNGMVTQRAGRLKTVMPFSHRFGLRGGLIASGSMYRGMGKYLGMQVLDQIQDHDPEVELAGRLQLAASLLDDFDFLHVHTKAPDQAAHRKDPLCKKNVIEALDKAIGRSAGALVDNPDVLVIVTADHSTPSRGPLIHSGEPTPVVMLGEGVRCDRVKRFSEIDSAAGVLGLVRGTELFHLVLNHLECATLTGIRDTPEAVLFWPGRYQPFRFSTRGDS